MDQEAARAAVRVTLAVMERLSRRTRSAADDLVAQMLRANEARIAAAVADLLGGPQPPTDEQIGAALQRVGIDA